MKKAMGFLLCLFLWQCDKLNPSSIEKNYEDDSTRVIDTLKVTDTTKITDTSKVIDTSNVTDTSKVKTDSLPFIGTWVVHQHSINYCPHRIIVS
jgi:hypothetical protein